MIGLLIVISVPGLGAGMLEAFHRLMGRLHPKVEEQALDILTDQIQEKAVEAFHDREPDWEDYRD